MNDAFLIENKNEGSKYIRKSVELCIDFLAIIIKWGKLFIDWIPNTMAHTYKKQKFIWVINLSRCLIRFDLGSQLNDNGNVPYKVRLVFQSLMI